MPYKIIALIYFCKIKEFIIFENKFDGCVLYVRNEIESENKKVQFYSIIGPEDTKELSMISLVRGTNMRHWPIANERALRETNTDGFPRSRSRPTLNLFLSSGKR